MPVIGMVPLAGSCPSPCAQMIESTLPLMICPGSVLSENSASFPGATWCSSFWLYIATTWPSASTSVITGFKRDARDERARPQLQVHHVAVARRAGRGLLEEPFRVLELGADLRHLRVLAVRPWRRASAGPAARSRRPARASARLRLHAAGRRQLALLLLHVGFGPLEVEPVAGAGCRELAVLLDALARELEPRTDRAGVALRLRDRAARFDDLALGALQRFLQLALLALRVGELRLERVHVELVGCRIDPEQDVALLHQDVALHDRHLEHAPLAPGRRSGSCTCRRAGRPTRARRC